MQWTAIKEVLAMREVLGKSILLHKPGSQERGQGWQKVADTLNLIDGFIVTGRAVRDKIMALIKKHRPMINKEKTQTGIGGDEPSEFDVLIEEIINISDDTLQKCEEATEKEKEKEKSALEIRKVAMETMGQTANRHKAGEKKERRAKRSSSDTLEFLNKKLEMDKENRRAELEQRQNQNIMFANLIQTQQQMMAQQMAMFQEMMNNKK